MSLIYSLLVSIAFLLPFNINEGLITITNDATKNNYEIVIFENERVILIKKMAPLEKIFIKSKNENDYRIRLFRLNKFPEYTICKDCKLLPRDRYGRVILTPYSNFHITTKDPRP